MALSQYDSGFLKDGDKSLVETYKKQYAAAQQAGDQAGMDAAHAGAEAVRAKYNYSGGNDGDQYIGTSQITAPTLTPISSSEQYIREMQAAKNKAQVQNLKTAYDANVRTLEDTRAKIAPTYQEQRNAAATDSERYKQSFNEYAAANGLNSGAGGQAELARQNTLAGNINTLNQAEAQANLDLDNQIAQLKTKYQNDIAAALNEGEYELAVALLDDYNKVQQSEYDTRLNQWNMDYQANQANYSRQRDAVSDARYAEELLYERQQAAEKQRLAQEEAARAAAQDEVNAILAAGAMPPAELVTASGYSQDYVNAMRSYYAQQAAAAAAKYSGGGGSGGGSGTKSGGSTVDAELNETAEPNATGLFEAAQNSGTPNAFINANYENFGFSKSTGLTTDYKAWEEAQNSAAAAEDEISIIDNYDDAVFFLRNNGGTNSAISGIISPRTWQAHRQAYLEGGLDRANARGGTDEAAALSYSSYAAYLQDYLRYALGL